MQRLGERVHDLGQLASRSKARVVLRETVEVSLWVIAGYLVAAGAALAATAPHASYGNPRLGPVLADLFMMVAATAAGLDLGRRLPWLLSGPLAAVGAYVVIGALTLKADDAFAALTPIDERWVTFRRVPSWVYLAQAAMWLLLASAAVSARLGARGWRRFAILWAAGVVATPLLLVNAQVRRPDLASMQLRCQPLESDATACLPLAKAYLMSPAVEALGRPAP